MTTLDALRCPCGAPVSIEADPFCVRCRAELDAKRRAERDDDASWLAGALRRYRLSQ